MISLWAERGSSNCISIKSPLAFFVNLFKKKKYKVKKNNVGDNKKSSASHKVQTSLSVSAMDMRMSSPCPISPALSTLTLTPGRIRDIDQDMEALRLSRQDNPFLQVLASRESLAESNFESESDDTNLMSQEFPSELEVDPLSLPEIHEHMIRSPPPTTWPKSPNFKVFRFPGPDSEDNFQGSHSLCGSYRRSPGRFTSSISSRDEEEFISRDYKSNELLNNYGGNYSTVHSFRTNVESPHKRSNSECRESLSNVFPMFRPTPIQSLSDSSRSQSNGNSEDQRPESLERRFDDEAPPTLPLLSKRFS